MKEDIIAANLSSMRQSIEEQYFAIIQKRS